MQDDELLTIGQVSELLGVSLRTLRHWEAKGLISPAARSWGNYRLYDHTDLERLQQILIYRATGMPLPEIAQLLAGGEPPLVHLERQLQLLQEKQGQLTQMIAAVTKIMEEQMQNTGLAATEIAQIIGDARFAEQLTEAEANWGDTAAWAESQQRSAAMTRGDWAALQTNIAAGEAELVAGFQAGVAAGSPEGNRLAQVHRGTIGAFYEVTPARQVILGRMYLADPRFTAHYDALAPGLTEWLVQVIEAAAAAQGVDLANPKWD